MQQISRGNAQFDPAPDQQYYGTGDSSDRNRNGKIRGDEQTDPNAKHEKQNIAHHLVFVYVGFHRLYHLLMRWKLWKFFWHRLIKQAKEQEHHQQETEHGRD